AVRPDRIIRVEPEKVLPELVCDWRHRHRRPGMAGLGLLDRVDRERPDRVDAEPVEMRAARCTVRFVVRGHGGILPVRIRRDAPPGITLRRCGPAWTMKNAPRRWRPRAWSRTE